MSSNLPFDDWVEPHEGPAGGEQPGDIASANWFEIEAGGPGQINRMASITGILVTSISSARNIGDGTITLNTGYSLNPNSDKWEGLIKEQDGPLVSCFVELSSIEAQDDELADSMPRNGWLESVDADLRSDGNRLGLFLTIKANLDGDIALQRIGYQVVLLFNSNRPPASSLTTGMKQRRPVVKAEAPVTRAATAATHESMGKTHKERTSQRSSRPRKGRRGRRLSEKA